MPLAQFAKRIVTMVVSLYGSAYQPAGAQDRDAGLADRVLDVSPTKALGRGRQTFVFPHMLDLPGR
jgi:hypothetical protein